MTIPIQVVPHDYVQTTYMLTMDMHTATGLSILLKAAIEQNVGMYPSFEKQMNELNEKLHASVHQYVKVVRSDDYK